VQLWKDTSTDFQYVWCIFGSGKVGRFAMKFIHLFCHVVSTSELFIVEMSG